MPCFQFQMHQPQVYGSGRYPNQAISSNWKLHRILEDYLVSPAIKHHLYILAFRVVWRHDDNVEPVWLEIVKHHQVLDGIVKNMPGLAFFLSSVSGTRVMNYKSGCRSSAISPALAYYVVLKEPGRMFQLPASLRAHYRHILSAEGVDSMKSQIEKGLSLIAKDIYGGKFVQMRVDESVAACQLDIAQGAHPVARLHVADSAFTWNIQAANAELRQIGVRVDADSMS